MPTIVTEFTPAPVCPYCGKPRSTWWDGCKLDHDGDTAVWQCGSCGLDFFVKLHMSICFSTRDLEAHFIDEISLHESWLELAEKEPEEMRRRVSDYDVVLARRKLKLAVLKQNMITIAEKRKQREKADAAEHSVVEEAEEDLDRG